MAAAVAVGGPRLVPREDILPVDIPCNTLYEPTCCDGPNTQGIYSEESCRPGQKILS